MAPMPSLSDPESLPFAPPPPGVTPDFSRPYTPERAVMIACVTTCLVLTTLFTTARLYARARLFKNLVVEDYLLVASYLAFNVFVILEAANPGTGKHVYDFTNGQSVLYLKLEHFDLIFYCLATILIRVTLILQVKRVLSVHRDKVWWFCHFMIWANSLFYVGCTFILIFQCAPQEAIWNVLVQGKCVPIKYMFYLPCVVNIIADVLMLLLPAVVVSQLSMPRKRKAGVLAIFGLGILSLVASIMRTYWTSVVLVSVEPFITIISLHNWAVIELSSLFIATCAQTLPRLWSHIRGKELRSTTYDITSSGQGGRSGTGQQWPKERSSRIPTSNTNMELDEVWTYEELEGRPVRLPPKSSRVEITGGYESSSMTGA